MNERHIPTKKYITKNEQFMILYLEYNLFKNNLKIVFASFKQSKRTKCRNFTKTASIIRISAILTSFTAKQRASVTWLLNVNDFDKRISSIGQFLLCFPVTGINVTNIYKLIQLMCICKSYIIMQPEVLYTK